MTSVSEFWSTPLKKGDSKIRWKNVRWNIEKEEKEEKEEKGEKEV